MAEEPQPAAAEAIPQAKEVVVAEEEKPSPPEEKAEVAEAAVEVAVAEEVEEPKKEAPLAAAEAAEEGEAMPQSVSFKEESNLVSDLADLEKKALDELKLLVAAALSNNEFSLPPPPPPPPPPVAPAPAPALKDDAPKPPESEEPNQPAEEEEEEKEKEPPPKPTEAAAAPPPPEEKAVEVVAAVVDDDGAKTVEAIEETVVPAAPLAPAPEAEEAFTETKTETKTEESASASASASEPEEVRIWGVPIAGDERSDAVLLKFLRARDYKAADAMSMLRSAVLWRKRFGIDSLLDADLGLPEMDRVVFTRGADRESHPVCYNVYGEFQNKDLYDKAFSDEDKRDRFLKWRIQYLEKGILSQLDFSPRGVCSFVQVTDLKNSPRLGKHRQVTRQALTLLQDNYPEFIAKKLFINVPWWYLAVNRMMSPFFTQRTKSKFVFAGPSKSAETLFKYIAPEQVPVQFGGLLAAKETDDADFTTSDAVTDAVVKPSSKQTIEIPVPENSTLVWEIRVLGWEVSYGAEFVPDAEDGYTVIVQKTRKLAANDEAVVKGSFKTGEAGKVVLIVDNPASKKKKLLYRSKTRSSAESI